MNNEQATLLKRIADVVRHVEVMDPTVSPITMHLYESACFMSEAVRHGLIDRESAIEREDSPGFGFCELFGITELEASKLIFHRGLRPEGDFTTGENYYTAVKELLTKYNYGHLYEQAMPFKELMDSLNEVTA